MRWDRRVKEYLQEQFRKGPRINSEGRQVFDGAALGMHLPLQNRPAKPVDERPGSYLTSFADEMAETFFGFGDWAAPYWFIGLEPGVAPGGVPDNSQIAQVWTRELDKQELVDCFEYHQAIRVDTWHREHPKLQPTWRPLILLLMATLGCDFDKEAIRRYQRMQWGQIHNAETCVIELSGIPAKSLAVKTDRKKYLEQRIEFIRGRIRFHNPKLVLMYGLTARTKWKDVAGRPQEQDMEVDKIYKIDSTLFVMTPSPTAHGRKDEDWVRLGLQLREKLNSE